MPAVDKLSLAFLIIISPSLDDNVLFKDIPLYLDWLSIKIAVVFPSSSVFPAPSVAIVEFISTLPALLELVIEIIP